MHFAGNSRSLLNVFPSIWTMTTVSVAYWLVFRSLISTCDVCVIASTSIQWATVLNLCSDLDLCNWSFCCMELLNVLFSLDMCTDYCCWCLVHELPCRNNLNWKNKSFHITQKPNRNPLDRTSMRSSAVELRELWLIFWFVFGVCTRYWFTRRIAVHKYTYLWTVVVAKVQCRRYIYLAFSVAAKFQKTPKPIVIEIILEQVDSKDDDSTPSLWKHQSKMKRIILLLIVIWPINKLNQVSSLRIVLRKAFRNSIGRPELDHPRMSLSLSLLLFSLASIRRIRLRAFLSLVGGPLCECIHSNRLSTSH